MDGIDLPSLVVGGGPWMIVAIGVIALIRGDLVPRKVHDRVIDDRDYYRGKLDTLTNRLLGVTEAYVDTATQAKLRAGLERLTPPTQERGQS